MIFKGKSAEGALDKTTECVFDPKSGKFIAEIKGGIFETEDKEVIERLKELGYKRIDEPEAKKKVGK